MYEYVISSWERCLVLDKNKNIMCVVPVNPDIDEDDEGECMEEMDKRAELITNALNSYRKEES